jgi:negative regulator of flagellin synthesis FlgM
MEIQSIGPNPIGQNNASEVQGARGRDGSAAAAHGAGPAAQRDAVSFSDEVRTLVNTMNAAEGAPEVRTELVNKFREAIANGSYQPDADAIAGNLLKGVQDA